MSPFYPYIKNQYLLGNFTDENLVTLVSKNRITDQERLDLLALK